MASYSALSWWHASLDAGSWRARATLPGDVSADVVVVGAGYTGLWTAYYLAARDPALRIVVLEAEVAGFGASGRNGGWCTALLPMPLRAVAATHGVDAARRLQSAMNATVDEVAAVTAEEGIDCDFVKGGWLGVARNAVQEARLRSARDELTEFGTSDEVVWLDAPEVRRRIGVPDALGGLHAGQAAVLHPARLVRGLAEAVERRDVTIYEHSPVTGIEPGAARTPLGTVRAPVVVRATEAFTPALRGQRRTVVPIYSLMIATEPLPAELWQRAGLAHREAFTDGRRMVVYGQRTADDRLVFGGRGAPYHFGSGVAPRFERDPGVHDGLAASLRDLFPYLGEVAITHRWGGAVAAARDWHCAVDLDRRSGLATAGGYVGDGVSTSNLAGRTLADLITATPSELVDLPLVGHRSPQWEREPLRWLGINAATRLPRSIDAHEQRTGRPARWRSRLLDRLVR